MNSFIDEVKPTPFEWVLIVTLIIPVTLAALVLSLVKRGKQQTGGAK